MSVIICTHNRAEYLGLALESALGQVFEGFEVIVVDNGSTDQTPGVVQGFEEDPRLVSIFEPRLGLSIARNRGARAARGEILVYLDDDAVASCYWLRALQDAFSDGQVAIAGGRCTLIWPPNTPVPPWLSPNLEGYLGRYDLGPIPRPITTAGDTPRGLNYALRRSFWQQMGGFNTGLGRVGANLLSNEELHMTQLALEQGYRVMYMPAAEVGHHVAPERLRRHWFLRRSWWQGISEYHRTQLAGTSALRQRSLGLLRGLKQALDHWQDPASRFDHLAYAYGQLGYLRAALNLWVGRPLVTTSDAVTSTD